MLRSLLCAVMMLSASPRAVLAAGEEPSRPTIADPRTAALMKKLDAMEKRIKTLEAQIKQTQKTPTAPAVRPPSTPAMLANASAAGPAAQPSAGGSQAAGNKPIPGMLDSPVPGLSLGVYGEVFFGAMQNPAANGQWQNGFDARRVVLLPTYAITDNITFNAEIEFEHAGAGFDNDDKLHGTAEIEQAWVDFKIFDQFNWRAPGVDLVPIGYINQHHEPTQFYSVFRPEIYNGLIPSTWKVPGTSIYGTITDGLRYQVMLSSSNEDFGDSFGNRTDAKTVPPPGTPYVAGIDGHGGLGFSDPPLGDFQQLSNTMAVSGKLDFAPAFLPGFAGSVSGYYSPNTTPRGAHDDFGNFLGHSSLAMFDSEFRYRVPNTGLELRAEYAQAMFGNPANLRANNDSDPSNNVGNAMFAYSGEVAYHVPLGTILSSEWEMVPFYRYTYQNLETGGFAGTDTNTPTGAGQTDFHTTGVAVFPSPKLVLKATYQKVKNRDPAGARSDSVLGAVGFFF